MRTATTTQIVFACIGLCSLLALQAFMVGGPTSILSQFLVSDKLALLSSLSCQLSFALTFPLIALITYFQPQFFSRVPFTEMVLSFAFGFLFLYTPLFLPNGSALFLLLSGVLLGCGQALGFICCTRIFASFELTLAKTLIIISSIFPVVPYFFATAFWQDELLISQGVVFILFPICMLMLYVSLRMIPIRPLNEVSNIDRRDKYKRIFKAIGIPVVLAFFLGLIGPAVGNAALDAQIPYLTRGLISQAGNTIAALIALLLWFAFKLRITVTHIYFLGFPILATLLLILPFVNESYWPGFLLISDLLFCLISLAVMATCLEVARTELVSILVVYGFFAGVIYLSRVIGIGIGKLISTSVSSHEMSVMVVALFLLYCLSTAIFLVFLKGSRRQKQSANEKAETASLQTVDSLTTRCEAMTEQYSLSKRESEMLEFLARGRSVPAIAEILVLSENTVRTHIKNLYSSLDIHTRQELIDLFESEGNTRR